MIHNNPPTTLDYLTTWVSPVGWFPYQVDAEHEAQLSGATCPPISLHVTATRLISLLNVPLFGAVDH